MKILIIVGSHVRLSVAASSNHEREREREIAALPPESSECVFVF